MKKLLFLLLAAAPLTTMAQKIELGFNAGGGISKDYVSGGYGSFKMNYHLNRHFMLGGSIDIGNLEHTLSATDPTGTDGFTERNELIFLNPTLSASAKFNIARSYIYAGVNTGYLAGGVDQYQYIYSQEMTTKDQTLNKQYIQGWSMGVHLGFTNHIVGKWSFNVEGSARMNTFPTGGVDLWTPMSKKQIATRAFGETTYYYPVSVGVRYSL